MKASRVRFRQMWPNSRMQIAFFPVPDHRQTAITDMDPSPEPILRSGRALFHPRLSRRGFTLYSANALIGVSVCTYPFSSFIIQRSGYIDSTSHILDGESPTYVTACDLVSNTRGWKQNTGYITSTFPHTRGKQRDFRYISELSALHV
jgi:hypothetical protein